MPGDRGSALLPRSGEDNENRRWSFARSLALVACAVSAAVGLATVAQMHTNATASATELVTAPAHRMGVIMNTLNHKLAVHANVGDFVISGDLKADTQSLK